MKSKIKISELLDTISKFNKLGYADKLKQWPELTKDRQITNIFYREFNFRTIYNIDDINFDIEIDNTIRIANLSISIPPKNEIETQIYLDWLLNKLKDNQLYNFEQTISNFSEEQLKDIDYLEKVKSKQMGLYHVTKNRKDSESIKNGFDYAIQNFTLANLQELPNGLESFLIGYNYGYLINQIQKWISEIQSLEKNVSEELELTSKTDQEKICLLYSIGIIDYIRTSQKGVSDNKIAELLSPITDIKVGSIKTTLSRIANNDLLEKYKISIDNKLDKLSLNRINETK
jgi:hypothetical protein